MNDREIAVVADIIDGERPAAEMERFASRAIERLFAHGFVTGASPDSENRDWSPSLRGVLRLSEFPEQPYDEYLAEDEAYGDEISEFTVWCPLGIDAEEGWAARSYLAPGGRGAGPYENSVVELAPLEVIEELLVQWLDRLRHRESPGRRRRHVDDPQAVRAALEVPLAAIASLADAGRFPEHVEHDLRIHLRGLHGWSQLHLPTTQGFEHLIAEIAQIVIDHRPQTDGLRDYLVGLGTDSVTAQQIVIKVEGALELVTNLGAEDAEEDGLTLAELENLAETLHEQLAHLDESRVVQPRTGLLLGEEAAKGAARAFGGTAVEKIVALAPSSAHAGRSV